MGGGGGEQRSQTVSQQQLSPEQQKLLGLVVPVAEKTIQNPPTFYPGQTFAGLDPLEKQAQEQMLATAAPGGTASATASAANDMLRFLSGPVLDPRNNPGLQGTFEAALRPLERTFTTGVLPNIRGEAIKSGQFGGSRQGIAEGLATQGFLDTAGDVTSRIASEAYGEGLGALTKGLALAPQTQQLQFGAPGVTAAVGSQRRAEEQLAIDEAIRRHAFEQLAPFQTAQAVAQMAFGMPGGASITEAVGPGPRGPGAFQGALGGAAIGSMFGPWGTAAGAGIGALMTLL